MKTTILLLAVFFFSCNNKIESVANHPKVKTQNIISPEKKPFDSTSFQTTGDSTLENVPLHQIKYSDSIRLCSPQIILGTSVHTIKSNKTGVSFLVNTIDNRVLRYYSNSKGEWKANAIILEDQELNWNNIKGNPTEFIGEYIYTDYYSGGEGDGTITKFKYKVVGSDIVLVDSLLGGAYSEGAGTWDWILSKKGKPIGIAFFDEIEELNDSLLLIRAGEKPKRYIINTTTLDTISKIEAPVGVWKAYLSGDKVLYNYWIHPDKHYLALLDRKGNFLWTTNTDFNYEIMSDYFNNLIIGSVLLGKGNEKETSIVAHDLGTGDPVWNFPMKKFSKGNSPRVKSLFQVGRRLYGALIEEYYTFENNKGRNYDLSLILFNSSGEICNTFNIISLERKLPGPLEVEKFAFVYERENEFKLVSMARTIKFKLN